VLGEDTDGLAASSADWKTATATSAAGRTDSDE
jgi:hypothetical protein